LNTQQLYKKGQTQSVYRYPSITLVGEKDFTFRMISKVKYLCE